MNNGNGRKPSASTQPIRCALYTRKSHEEGLDQELNSLDVQREAAEAYVKSQAQEGWVAVDTRYDDGGFSGATIERPAMKRLIEDVEGGKVDCVVVYKVDRLSRSLLDFTKLVELFDRKGVSFVSVTQQFNTTTSMGRLTLNVLLSFAQFEREVIAERIRDKFAASRKRGKHMGGAPVLGYDIDRAQKRLVVNPTEADLVRHIFRRFIEMCSTTELVKELNAAGHRTKAWTTVKGRARTGVPWHKGHLYRLLNNCLYIGEVNHRGTRYPGEHEAIIDQGTWEKTQEILAANHPVRKVERRQDNHALLKGLVRCSACGCGMTPTFSIRRGKIYRYYLCMRAAKVGVEGCPVRRVGARELEETVINQLRSLLRSPVELLRQLRTRGTGALQGQAGQRRDEEMPVGNHEETAASLPADPALCAGLEQLNKLWDDLFPAGRERIVRLLLEEVRVAPEYLELAVNIEALESLAREVSRGTAGRGYGDGTDATGVMQG